MSAQELRDGMVVFDPSGHRVGHVESPVSGHFFLTRESFPPLVTERIVVNASTSVASVDADGVHLRHGRQELLALQTRPADAQSLHQLAPGEDPATFHRGDEDHRPLDVGDRGDVQKAAKDRHA